MSTQEKGGPSTAHSVLFPRLILGTLLFVSIFLPSLFQPILTKVYTCLYHSSIYRFSGFETIETILCYAIIEILFTYKFGRNPHLRIDVRASRQKGVTTDENGKTVTTSKPKLPKMRRPSKRMGEMLIYAAPLLLMDFTMIKKFAGVPISDIRASGGYASSTIDHLPDDNLTTISLLTTTATSTTAAQFPFLNHTLHPITPSSTISPSFLLPTLHNFTLTSPLQLSRALPPPHPHPPTPRTLTLQLLLSLLIYDTLFFAFHLLLHRSSPILSQHHTPHHRHSEMHPQITNRLSLFERLSLVLLANFSLHVTGSHVLTRTLFIPLFVYLLVELHSGLDLPWGYEKVLPAGWGSGARVHARHHRSGVGGLAPFFGWWDHALRVWDERGLARGGEGGE